MYPRARTRVHIRYLLYLLYLRGPEAAVHADFRAVIRTNGTVSTGQMVLWITRKSHTRHLVRWIIRKKHIILLFENCLTLNPFHCIIVKSTAKKKLKNVIR